MTSYRFSTIRFRQRNVRRAEEEKKKKKRERYKILAMPEKVDGDMMYHVKLFEYIASDQNSMLNKTGR